MESQATASQEAALRILASCKYHQSLWIPETTSHGKLRVTFSTTSNFEDATLPTILFCAPMFASRWNVFNIDQVADEAGVRVICVDRPGMGGSTQVPVDQRMETWLETVPLLLQKLGVQHVSLLSHSAGTLYLFNTLYRLREILDSKAPYAALLGPWCHNKHSKAPLPNVASVLPTSILTKWSGLNSFINTHVLPASAWSGDLVSSLTTFLRINTGQEDSDPLSWGPAGTTKEVAKAGLKLQSKYIREENTKGLNDELLLCLNKGNGANIWGIPEDYGEFMRSFLVQEKQRRQHQNPADQKLSVKFFFAESDIMIGKGGEEYIRRSWGQDGVAEVVDVEFTTKKDTNHESVILDLEKGALRTVFAEVAALH